MALPVDFDFVKDKSASPERMNALMGYLDARFRALEAVTPDYLAAIDALKQVGLDRLSEALVPIFANASEIATELAAIQAQWLDTDFSGQLVDDTLTALRDGVDDEFDTLDKMADKIIDYRSKYLGAKASAPTVDDNGDPVAAGATYFDTTLDETRAFNGITWRSIGSTVQALMARQAYTAAGGETSVTVTGGYDPGNIIVAVNGYVLSPADVTVTSGTAIGLVGALTAGDEVTWVKFGAITLANVYQKYEIDGFFAAQAASQAALAARIAMDSNFNSRRVR